MDIDSPIDTSRLLLDQIADKWTILILGALCNAGGRARFNAIRRDVGDITQKSLARPRTQRPDRTHCPHYLTGWRRIQHHPARSHPQRALRRDAPVGTSASSRRRCSPPAV